MDLGNIKVNDTVTIIITHPHTGMETDMSIVAYTTDSDFYKNLIHERRNDFMRKKGVQKSSEQMDAEAMNTICKCVIEVNNIVDNGTPYTNEFRSVKKLFKKHAWIYEQVDFGINDRKNFLEIAPDKE